MANRPQDASSHRGSSNVPGGTGSGGIPTAGRSVPPVTPAEKLEALLGLGLTSSEIAVSIGTSVSAVNQRRRKFKDERLSGKGRSTKADERIDDLYSIVSTLEARYFIEPENIRAWLIGRSAYLDEERPAALLADGKYTLVRKAAIAYATGETPAEFLDQRARAGI